MNRFTTTSFLRYTRCLLAIGLMAACAFLLCELSGCSASTPPAEKPAYISPYDWSGLTREGDRITYSEKGVQLSEIGVDVSDHQGYIDWTAAAADGIDFAFVRMAYRGYTEGGLFADELCIQNLDGAQAAGLETGAYFFSQAINVQEAQEEADFILDQLNGRTLDLPIAFDHEPITGQTGRADHVDTSTLTQCALAFCERLETAGYTTMIYGNKGDMARYDLDALNGKLVWLAEYNAGVPSAQFDFVLWQYTSEGTVAGISTPTDLNLRFTHML